MAFTSSQLIVAIVHVSRGVADPAKDSHNVIRELLALDQIGGDQAKARAALAFLFATEQRGRYDADQVLAVGRRLTHDYDNPTAIAYEYCAKCYPGLIDAFPSVIDTDAMGRLIMAKLSGDYFEHQASGRIYRFKR